MAKNSQPVSPGVTDPGFSPFVAAPSNRALPSMTAYVAAIFLGAFLLFQVQPIIARYILPWYGGTPAVWTTCMLFFQLGLLGGYAYAHGLVCVFRERKVMQAGVHLALLAVVLLLLPITPSPDMKPENSAVDPVFGIIKLLTATVGLPYLLLAASGPIIQHWFSEAHPGRSPFRLYAVSNLGSLLGLISYPFLFEPRFGVTRQAAIWSIAFIVFSVLVLVVGWSFLRAPRERSRNDDSAAAVQGESRDPVTCSRTTRFLLWIGFSACGSMLLLSVTNQMCQDVAVVPFLWVLPLSLYLLTFVVAFDHARWYWRPVAIPLAAVCIWVEVMVMGSQVTMGDLPIQVHIVIHSLALFLGCLVCHGEVARLKPGPHRLTGFYLAIALGGAAGGLVVSLLAPLVFEGYWELHFTLILLALLVSQRLFCWLDPFRRRWLDGSKPRGAIRIGVAGVSIIMWMLALVGIGLGLLRHVRTTRESSIAASRGFYGVLRVTEKNPGRPNGFRALSHGRIDHGVQLTYPPNRSIATSYYETGSGVGVAIRTLPGRRIEPPSPIHVGVVGLGVGTLATYAMPGDHFRFYEINPQVVAFARSHFTYLDDCDGEVSVVLGDGRISLERELAAGVSHSFDLLVIDAFSGDSIPVHLLTREAFELYFRHLAEDGILAIHITNRFLDLTDPIRNIAETSGRSAYLVSHDPGKQRFSSDWILITMDPPTALGLEGCGAVTPWARKIAKPIHWTDDYSNLFEVIR